MGRGLVGLLSLEPSVVVLSPSGSWSLEVEGPGIPNRWAVQLAEQRLGAAPSLIAAHRLVDGRLAQRGLLAASYHRHQLDRPFADLNVAELDRSRRLDVPLLVALHGHPTFDCIGLRAP